MRPSLQIKIHLNLFKGSGAHSLIQACSFWAVPSPPLEKHMRWGPRIGRDLSCRDLKRRDWRCALAGEICSSGTYLTGLGSSVIHSDFALQDFRGALSVTRTHFLCLEDDAFSWESVSWGRVLPRPGRFPMVQRQKHRSVGESPQDLLVHVGEASAHC